MSSHDPAFNERRKLWSEMERIFYKLDQLPPPPLACANFGSSLAFVARPGGELQSFLHRMLNGKRQSKASTPKH